MKELQYLENIIQELLAQAATKKLQSTDDVSIDWGELQFILNHASANTKLLTTMEKMIHSCLTEDREKIINMFSEQGYEKHLHAPQTQSQPLEICYLCNKETSIIRNEQITVMNDSNELKVKCLDCVFDQMKHLRAESEQLSSYRWFVKERNLEEAFEYFYEEQKTSPQ